MWTIFGSVITSDKGVAQGHPHYGRACQRNGVVYRWVFSKGSYLVADIKMVIVSVNTR